MQGFRYFNSYHKSLRKLPDNIRLMIHDAIDDFMFDDIEPTFDDPVAVAVFELMRPTLEKSKKKAAAGETKNENEIKTESNEIKTKNTPPKDKDRDREKDKEKDKEIPPTPLTEIMQSWNALSDVGIKPIDRITDKRKEMLNARIREYTADKIFAAINKIRGSDFLQGKNKNGWTVTFDWFIKPGNFPKVLEGNYDNKGEVLNGCGAPKGWANNIDAYGRYIGAG